MIISTEAQKILKTLHLLAVCFWVGGGMGQILLLSATQDAGSAGELFGILKSYRFINVIVTVYMGAYGSLFTGLAYSLCTNRGFFRHKWIIIKWVMTLTMMLCGSLFLSAWSTQMLESAVNVGLAALQTEEFQHLYEKHLLALIGFMVLFVAATLLSVYKPWEREELFHQQWTR